MGSLVLTKKGHLWEASKWSVSKELVEALNPRAHANDCFHCGPDCQEHVGSECSLNDISKAPNGRSGREINKEDENNGAAASEVSNYKPVRIHNQKRKYMVCSLTSPPLWAILKSQHSAGFEFMEGKKRDTCGLAWNINVHVFGMSKISFGPFDLRRMLVHSRRPFEKVNSWWN